MQCKCYYYNHRDTALRIAKVFGELNYPRLANVPVLKDEMWQCWIYPTDTDQPILTGLAGNCSLVCFVHDTLEMPRWREWAITHGNRVFVVFVSEGAHIQLGRGDPDNVDVLDNQFNAADVLEYVNILCTEGEL